jgi:hypothetical protein
MEFMLSLDMFTLTITVQLSRFMEIVGVGFQLMLNP